MAATLHGRAGWLAPIACLLLVLSLGGCAGHSTGSDAEPLSPPRTFSGDLVTPFPPPRLDYCEGTGDLPFADSAILTLGPLGSDEAWVLTTDGHLYLYTMGTWNPVGEAAGIQLDAADLLAPNEVWAVGGCGPEATIVHFDGAHWDERPLPILAQDECLVAIDLFAPDQCAVIVSTGVLLHYAQGTWSRLSDPLLDGLYSVHLVSSREGWLLASPQVPAERAGYPALLHLEGDSVRLEPSGDRTRLLALDMMSAQEGWLVGTGYARHYTDGAWTAAAPPSPESLHVISASGSGGVWAAGEGVLVHHTPHGWERFVMCWRSVPSSLVMFSSGDGWIQFGTYLVPVTPYVSFAVSDEARVPPAQLAYIGLDGGIWLMLSDGTEAQRLFDGQAYDIRSIAWHPSGAHISFASMRAGLSRLQLLDVAEGAVEDLQIDAVDPMHSWSPDGTKLVYATGQGLAVQDLSDGSSYSLTDDPTDLEPRWSPTDHAILFTRGEPGHRVVWSVPPDLSQSPVPMMDGCCGPAWSPNAVSIAIGSAPKLAAVPVLGGYTRTYVDDFTYGNHPSWAADGRLAYEFTDRIYVLSYSTASPIAAGHCPVWRPESGLP